MIKAYKIVNSKAQLGTYTKQTYVPSDFTPYTVGQEPQELIDAMAYKTPEELVALGESAVTSHIQEPINSYNNTHGTKFGSVHNCANYKDSAGYTHKQFCMDVWLFNVEVWEAARAMQETVLSGIPPIPTEAEFKALLPIYVGVV